MIIQKVSTIAAHVILSAGLAIVTAFAGYLIFVEALERARVEQLDSYITVRAQRDQALFEQAENLNLAAERVFLRRLTGLEDVDIDTNFDRLFPVLDDGTRRSVPALFEGMREPDGDYVFGVGAFSVMATRCRTMPNAIIWPPIKPCVLSVKRIWINSAHYIFSRRTGVS